MEVYVVTTNTFNGVDSFSVVVAVCATVEAADAWLAKNDPNASDYADYYEYKKFTMEGL